MSSRVWYRRFAMVGTSTGGMVVGCQYLERQGQQRPLHRRHYTSTSTSTVAEAVTMLERSGIAVCGENLRIDDALIQKVRSMPAAASMPTRERKASRARRRAPPGRSFEPDDSPWRVSSMGRYHCRDDRLLTDGTEQDRHVLETVEAQIYPLVEAFFASSQPNDDNNNKNNSNNNNNNNSNIQIYRSELQLMTAVPGAVHQTWHRDNRSRGLSILIPLVDFEARNGGTQLLPGTHHSTFSTETSANAEEAQVVHAPAGSVVAYDSRTIHRGLGNQSPMARPALIFCYDSVDSPPPGTGTFGSIFTAYQGRIRDVGTGAWWEIRSLLGYH